MIAQLNFDLIFKNFRKKRKNPRIELKITRDYKLAADFSHFDGVLYFVERNETYTNVHNMIHVRTQNLKCMQEFQSTTYRWLYRGSAHSPNSQ